MRTLHVSTRDHYIWKGPKRWIRIFIHETPEELQEAACSYSPRADWRGVHGCFHPARYRERHVNGEWVNKSSRHYAGTMRFCSDDVNALNVSHEAVHAACQIYRMDVRPVLSLGRECWQAEEHLAYIIGDVTAGITIALHEAKAWSFYKEE